MTEYLECKNSCVRDPATIQFLYEVSRSLHDCIDLSTINSFLVQCGGAFGSMSEVKETIVHSSNLLVAKASRNDSSYVIFVKSCIACSEVTIPSIPSHLKQLNLYLETAEVALMDGLVSHSDGLVDSALRCLHNVDLLEGNIELGLTSIPRNVFSILSSLSWMLPHVKVKMLCALISTVAALSQNNLLYHAVHDDVLGNDSLFYFDQQYLQELFSFSAVLLQRLNDTAAEGNLALDACNAIASSCEVCQGTSDICSKLVETAKLSLQCNNRYLQSTIEFLNNCGLMQRGDS
ncbi:unnamed protein product [Withania somnifera]